MSASHIYALEATWLVATKQWFPSSWLPLQSAAELVEKDGSTRRVVNDEWKVIAASIIPW